jgi:GT2 family glycosyltransferase
LASIDSADREVVYVDSGSTDGSREAAAQRGATVVDLDLGEPFTAARARNAGFAALRTRSPDVRFVQFIDGDCALDPRWLDTAGAFLAAHADVAVVCGRRRERHPEATIYNALADLEWNTPVGETSACGGDALVRAAAFSAVGGYRSGLIAGEEPEMCLRLRERGWKIWRLDAEMTRHDAAISRFSQWWVRAMRAGHAYAEVAWLHRDSKFAIWKTHALRALLWGGALPVAIVAGSIASKFAALGVFVYGLQIVRLAVRRGPGNSFSWMHATLTTVTKPAEFLGMAKYFLRRTFRRSAVIIEYK